MSTINYIKKLVKKNVFDKIKNQVLQKFSAELEVLIIIRPELVKKKKVFHIILNSRVEFNLII